VASAQPADLKGVMRGNATEWVRNFGAGREGPARLAPPRSPNEKHQRLKKKEGGTFFGGSADES
jgi:hypothetical protein